MNKGRLEAFSDGVFAIIITIMVLEIKVPHGSDWASVKPLLSTLSSYVLSFLYVAIYWGNHHHLLHTVKSVNSAIIWANINLLFWLSLIPVATGWMGENHFAPNTITVYAALLLVTGIAFTILQRAVVKTNPHGQLLTEAFERLRVKGLISVMCYTAAIPLAYVSTFISGILFLFVSIMWLVPDRNIERALKEKEQ